MSPATYIRQRATSLGAGAAHAVLGVLLAATLAIAAAQTMVAPALPVLAVELDSSPGATSWLLTAFLVSAAVWTPIVGKLGDVHGRGRVFTIVLLIYAGASVVCAMSDSLGPAIAARVVQGVAGGVFPLAFGIIRETFPPARVPMSIGLVSATFGIGSGFGFVLGGLIADNLDPSWVFGVGLLAAPVALLARALIPESGARRRVRIDWIGALLLSAGLALLLLGVSNANAWGWNSAAVLAMTGAGAVTLAAWVALERRQPEPLVDLALLRHRPVLASNVVALMIGAAMFISFLLVPQFAQTPQSVGYGFDASVTESGLLLLPSAFTMLVGGPLAGAIGARLGSRFSLILGMLLIGGAFVLLVLAHDHAWQIALSGGLQGAGIAFALASMANLVVQSVDPRDVGVATGFNSIMRTTGGAFGSQVAVAILAATTLGGTSLPTEHGFTLAFLVALAGIGLALVAALSIPRRTGPAAGVAGELAAQRA